MPRLAASSSSAFHLGWPHDRAPHDRLSRRAARRARAPGVRGARLAGWATRRAARRHPRLRVLLDRGGDPPHERAARRRAQRLDHRRPRREHAVVRAAVAVRRPGGRQEPQPVVPRHVRRDVHGRARARDLRRADRAGGRPDRPARRRPRRGSRAVHDLRARPGGGAGALACRGVRSAVRRAPGAERRTRRHDLRRSGGRGRPVDHRRGRRLRPARGGSSRDARGGRPQRAAVARDAARPGHAAEARDAVRRRVRLAAVPRSRLVGGCGRRRRRGCRRRATRPRQESLRRRVGGDSKRHATASCSSSPRARRSPTTACCSASARSSPPLSSAWAARVPWAAGRPTSEARA